MWIHHHWRLVAGGVFTVLAGLAVAAVLVFFPPALPFIAGFIALSASALIPIVTALAMAAAAFLATLFNVVCKWLADEDKDIPWGLSTYDHRSADKYSYFKVFGYSLLIGIAAFLITAAVGLIGGAAFLSSPLWAAAGTALAIGFGIGVLLHIAFFGSLRLDNLCGQQIAEKEPYSAPKKSKSKKSEANLELFAEDGYDLDPKIKKKPTGRFAGLFRRNPEETSDIEEVEEEELEEQKVSQATKSPSPKTTTQPLAAESKAISPLNTPKPPSGPNPHKKKREKEAAAAAAQADEPTAQETPKPVPPPGKPRRHRNKDKDKEGSESKREHRHHKRHKAHTEQDNGPNVSLDSEASYALAISAISAKAAADIAKIKRAKEERDAVDSDSSLSPTSPAT